METFITKLEKNYEKDYLRVAVRFPENINTKDRPTKAAELGLNEKHYVPLQSRKFTMFNVKSRNEWKQKKAKVDSYVSKIYKCKANPNETLVLLPEIMVTGPRDTLMAASNAVGGELKIRRDHRENESGVITLSKGSDLTTAMNTLYHKYSDLCPVPNSLRIILKVNPFTVRPNSRLSQNDKEWYHKIIGAPEAWRLVNGDPDVKIAILDEGVDIYHEDLKAAIKFPYDAILDDDNPSPIGNDAHGTSCAGLAAGINNNIGVRGIGSGCSIVPVRIAFSDYIGDELRWYITDDAISRAFDHAVRVNAQIISNSWGGGNNFGYKVALQRALDKGCIVVAAAGNESRTPVSYPARTSGVICVSASNNLDKPKRINDGSFEDWWGTNYGKNVWIAAPGVQMYTTDISGPLGYDPKDYTAIFNGTSSATPVVAGAIGLILSANSRLSAVQVKEILRDTAEKVGGDVDPYVNGKNNFMGYGRLNVFKAVQAALNYRTQ